MNIRYIAAVLALIGFSAHASVTLNGLPMNGLRLKNGLGINGLNVRNGLGINGLQLNGAPGTSAPTSALVDLANRPLVVQD